MNTIEKSLEVTSKKYDADIIVYNSGIDAEGAEKIINVTSSPTNKNLIFILCTSGGCPNAAFKIARHLQDKYEKFTLYVHGYCKSAGTFIAAGSDKIVMSDFAEFGPLDVQLQEKDEIARYSSGLNINEALVNLKQETRVLFRQMVVELTTGAGISTKMATEVASNFSLEFFSPIVSQIEPMKFGEIRRGLKIATAYGERLIQDGRGNLRSAEALAKLVEAYPDHGFVIDFKEAKTLFKDVEKETDEIKTLGEDLSQIIKYPTEACLITKLYPTEEKQNGSVDKPKNTKRAGKSEGGKRSSDTENSGESVSANDDAEKVA